MELNQIDCRTNIREKERERQKPADSTLLLLKLAWYQRVFSIKRLVTHFRSHRTNPMNRTNWTRIPGSVHIRSCNMFSMPYFALSHTIHVFWCFFFSNYDFGRLKTKCRRSNCSMNRDMCDALSLSQLSLYGNIERKCCQNAEQFFAICPGIWTV